jgi:hypothetical protein
LVTNDETTIVPNNDKHYNILLATYFWYSYAGRIFTHTQDFPSIRLPAQGTICPASWNRWALDLMEE